MSAHRNTRHRPRSHSVSNSPVLRRTPEDSWRIATKRTLPQQTPNGALSSPQKWDVDAWRRGKRARRTVDLPTGRTSPTNDYDKPRRTGSAPHTPLFASTSVEFNLYPDRNRKKPLFLQLSPPADSTFTFTADFDIPNENDLTRLRSDAFWELHRAVADNGEHLVRRMRDYEASRSRSSVYTTGGRNPHRRGRARTSDERSVDAEEWEGLGAVSDDDVKIHNERSPDGGQQKKRALSLGLLDSPQFLGLEAYDCSSPVTYPSDYEGSPNSDHELAQLSAINASPPAPSGVTPALSHTYSTSANSSLVSLPLPPPLRLPRTHTSPSSPSYAWLPPSTASRSEKAIAALSLAMANGAGGLNDYQALLTAQGPSLLEDAGVGELWH